VDIIIPVLFGINGLRNNPPLPVFKAYFSAIPGWHFPKDLIEISLIGGHGYSHIIICSGWQKLPLGTVYAFDVGVHGSDLHGSKATSVISW